MPLVPEPINCDESVKRSIRAMSKKLGYTGYPTHAGLTLTGLTASTLIGADADKALESVTVGTGLDYTRPNLTLSHLGIEALVDPGVDKILFWDESAPNACKWLGMGNSIAITDVTLDTIQDIRTTATPTFNGLIVSDDGYIGSVSEPTAMQIASTGVVTFEDEIDLGTHRVNCGSINRTAGTLLFQIGLVTKFSLSATTATFAGNVVIPSDGYIGSAGDPNAIQIAASGQVTFTDVVTGVYPTAGAHLATKEYVDLALGTRDTFFLSNTATGIGDLYYMYQHETTEAESTIVSGAMGAADDQLVASYITEAGQPNTTLINAGVVAFDIHAKKGAANHRTTNLYCVLSYVESDGTTNKTTIATSAICAELTDTETICHIHASLSESVEIDITDRIILEVFANVGAGALNSVVTLYMEGVHDSHVDFEVSGGIWQNWGVVLDDLNTVGTVGADSEFLVGTGVGAFAWESGATVRASLGLTIGTHVQAWNAALDSVVALGAIADDEFIVGTGAGTYAHESGATVRASLGLTVANLTEITSNVLTITGGTGCVIGTGTTIVVGLATPTSSDTSHLSTASQIWNWAASAFSLIAHLHDTDTLECDAISSDAGAFSFTTAGVVTFSGGIAVPAGKTIALSGHMVLPIDNSIIGCSDGTPQITFDDTDNQIEVAGNIVGSNSLYLTEKDNADTDVGTLGQVWVKTGAPNTLWFTNEDGTDAQLGVGGGGISNLDGGSSATVYTGVTGTPIDGGSA